MIIGGWGGRIDAIRLPVSYIIRGKYRGVIVAPMIVRDADQIKAINLILGSAEVHLSL